MNTHSTALKCVLSMLIAGCAWLVVSAAMQIPDGNYWPALLACILWGPLGWGLWQMHPLARRVVVVLLWFIVLVLPVGVINPFAAMDGAIPADQPIWQIALPLFGLVAVALFMLHVLGKHKAEFTRHDRH